MSEVENWRIEGDEGRDGKPGEQKEMETWRTQSGNGGESVNEREAGGERESFQTLFPIYIFVYTNIGRWMDRERERELAIQTLRSNKNHDTTDGTQRDTWSRLRGRLRKSLRQSNRWNLES